MNLSKDFRWKSPLDINGLTEHSDGSSNIIQSQSESQLCFFLFSDLVVDLFCLFIKQTVRS